MLLWKHILADSFDCKSIRRKICHFCRTKECSLSKLLVRFIMHADWPKLRMSVKLSITGLLYKSNHCSLCLQKLFKGMGFRSYMNIHLPVNSACTGVSIHFVGWLHTLCIVHIDHSVVFVYLSQRWTFLFLIAVTSCSIAQHGLRRRPWRGPGVRSNFRV